VHARTCVEKEDGRVLIGLVVHTGRTTSSTLLSRKLPNQPASTNTRAVTVIRTRLQKKEEHQDETMLGGV
jgi:DNA-binding response OmpR family regulator